LSISSFTVNFKAALIPHTHYRLPLSSRTSLICWNESGSTEVKIEMGTGISYQPSRRGNSHCSKFDLWRIIFFLPLTCKSTSILKESRISFVRTTFDFQCVNRFGECQCRWCPNRLWNK
jgi:hypothetical protein